MDDIREATPEILEAGRRFIAATLALPPGLHQQAELEWQASGYQASPLREEWVLLAAEEARAQRELKLVLTGQPGWHLVDNFLVRYSPNRWRHAYVEVRPRLSVLHKRTARVPAR